MVHTIRVRGEFLTNVGSCCIWLSGFSDGGRRLGLMYNAMRVVQFAKA